MQSEGCRQEEWSKVPADVRRWRRLNNRLCLKSFQALAHFLRLICFLYDSAALRLMVGSRKRKKVRGRVAPGGYPPGAPTDPYVHF